MKNKIHYIKTIFLCFSLALVFSACEKRLDELRPNPNSVTEIDDAALFTNATRSLFLSTTDQSASQFAGQYAHFFMAGSTARFPDQYTSGFDENYEGMFSSVYGNVIRNIEEVLVITAADKTKNDVRSAIANVIAVMGYARITDAFGDIPYTEGGKGKTGDIVLPKYDTQESIYKSMIDKLTASIATLKTADPAKGYQKSDFVYNNDLTKWVRLANSVRLRLAMRLRFANKALSQATVTQCLANPLIETNDQNAAMIQTEGNGNTWFENRTNFPSIKMSSFLIGKLQSTNDPRLPVFVSKDAAGKYTGITNGLTDAVFGSSNFAAKSDMGLALSSKDSKLYLMTAAEIWLLRAEAALVYDNNKTLANTNYIKGIEASLDQWQVSAADKTAFLATPIATLSGTNDEEKIGTQTWLALVPEYFEAWTHIRRTGFPVIPVRTTPDLEKGVTNGIMPKRFLYSSFELSSNKTNVTEAISRQGGNKIDIPVWWDKN